MSNIATTHPVELKDRTFRLFVVCSASPLSSIGVHRGAATAGMTRTVAYDEGTMALPANTSSAVKALGMLFLHQLLAFRPLEFTMIKSSRIGSQLSLSVSSRNCLSLDSATIGFKLFSFTHNILPLFRS